MRTLGFAFLEAKFGPISSLRHHGIHSFFVDCGAGFAGHFHLAALVVDFVGDCGFGAILVYGSNGSREGGGVVDLFRVGDVVCPVWAAVCVEILG